MVCLKELFFLYFLIPFLPLSHELLLLLHLYLDCTCRLKRVVLVQLL
jgi:hypothetical protein